MYPTMSSDQGTPLRLKRKTSVNTLNRSCAAPFQIGECVYVRGKDRCWVPAVLQDISNDRIVSHTNNGEKVVCGREDVLHCTNTSLSDTCRLSDLAPLNEATVLYCLGERLDKDCIYTRAGSTVVAVNPFRDIPSLYTLQAVDHYHCRDSNDQPTCPHIYEIADEAYCGLQRDVDPIHQCIIVSGESGAGKTVSAKHLLRYLTVVANPMTDSSTQDRKLSECTGKGRVIERRILDSNPILEAFGNAATPRNDNSSRFGKFIQLQFQRSGHIGGASIDTYLLEKTRVVHQGPGDCNFHVFYQLCEESERNSSLQSKWLLELKEQLAGHSFDIVPHNNVKEKRSLQATLEAMSDIGLTETLQQAVFRVVAGILFLCNIDFSALEEDYSCLSSQSATSQATAQCCPLLGISPDALEQGLLHRSIASGGDKRRSIFVKPVSIAEAKSRRDCLAMLLYSRLFDWLVSFINQQIKSEDRSHSIGLLDIYGFEMFEANSLEQLCINYANEKLQQHYVRHFLGDLQKEYAEEHIAWQHIDYQDNQPCLDILEGKVGVFGVLNEEVYLNRKSNPRALGERVLDVSQKVPGAIKRPKTFSTKPAFVIQHYAGDVRYDLEHVTTKNKDNIPVELVSLLTNSDNSFLSHLFEDFNTVEASGKKKKTVLTKFKASLDELMSTLKASDVHYIRCIKPNRSSQPGQFDPPYVLQQLKANGILETVEICRRGYSTRLPYMDFLQRYGLLLREDTACLDSGSSTNKENDQSDPVEVLLQKHLDQANTPRHSTTPQRILRRRSGFSSLDHTRKCCAAVLTKVLGSKFLKSGALRNQFGKNKIFLLQQQFEVLECARSELCARYAKIIQRAWLSHKKYQARKRQHAVCVIWRYWQMYKGRKQRTQCHRAASCMQRAVRRWLSWIRFQKALRAIKNHRTLIPGSHNSHQSSPGRTSKRKLSDTSSLEQSVSKATKSTSIGPSGRTLSANRSGHDSSMSDSGWMSEDSGVDVSHLACKGGDGGPPVKKLKLSCSKYSGLQNMHVGDGVITRRTLVTRGMRFHTRESVLKNAHVVHKRELDRGLTTDCLIDD